jgi:hypothetical protein
MAKRLADGSIRLNDGRTIYANSIVNAQDLLEILELVVPQLSPPAWPFISGGGGGGGISTSPGGTGTGTGQNGAQGNQGNQGDQGAFGGPQGNQGNQGILGTGVQGNQGPFGGPQGNQGNQGTGGNGNQGNQGNQGAIGSGNQGPQGIAGVQGNQGSQGAQGNQGFGNQGLQGPQGSQGSQGSQGNQGIAGPLDVLWTFPGQLATDQDLSIYELKVRRPMSFIAFDANLRVAPTGADVLVDWAVNGVVNPAYRVTVTAGTTYGETVVAASLSINDLIRPIVTQVGSSVPGTTMVMRARGL